MIYAMQKKWQQIEDCCVSNQFGRLQEKPLKTDNPNETGFLNFETRGFCVRQLFRNGIEETLAGLGNLCLVARTFMAAVKDAYWDVAHTGRIRECAVREFGHFADYSLGGILRAVNLIKDSILLFAGGVIHPGIAVKTVHAE